MEKNNKKPAVKQKFYYDIKVECLLPSTLIYHILAETAEQAAELIKNQQPSGVKYKLTGRKNIKLMVYDAGSTMIRFIKNLVK